MTFDMRNAAYDLVSAFMFPTGNQVAFASMENTIYINSRIALDNFSATGCIITQTHKIPFTHSRTLF